MSCEMTTWLFIKVPTVRRKKNSSLGPRKSTFLPMLLLPKARAITGAWLHWAVNLHTGASTEMFHSPFFSLSFFCSVGCFHSRNKLLGRGRETQVKWEQKREQSCQHKKRNGKKTPSNQRSWKHRGSLPPLITAIPTSKCLQVRSDPLLECCTLWKMLPAEP